MKLTRLAASVATLLLLAGCAGAPGPEPEQPQPSPTAPAPAPETAPPPEPPAPADPYEGWTETVFASGFASVQTPPGADPSVHERDEAGSAPRFLGGDVLVFPNTDRLTSVAVRSAELPSWQSGTVCGDVLLGEYDGAPGIASEHKLWATTTVEGDYRYITLMLASADPHGENCGSVIDLAAPDGGAVRAAMVRSMPGSVTEAEAAAWLESAEAREVMLVMQSVTVR